MDKRFELLKIYYDLERENTTSILLIKFNWTVEFYLYHFFESNEMSRFGDSNNFTPYSHKRTDKGLVPH